MTNSDKIRANISIAESWCDDSTDMYERRQLASMIRVCRDPQHKQHTGPLSPDVCRAWAACERKRGEHATASTLDDLADKLHEVCE